MSPRELILLGQWTIYSYNFKSNLKADLIPNISVKFFIKHSKLTFTIYAVILNLWPLSKPSSICFTLKILNMGVYSNGNVFSLKTELLGPQPPCSGAAFVEWVVNAYSYVKFRSTVREVNLEETATKSTCPYDSAISRVSPQGEC